MWSTVCDVFDKPIEPKNDNKEKTAKADNVRQGKKKNKK